MTEPPRLLVVVSAYGAFVDRPFAHLNRAVADGAYRGLVASAPSGAAVA